MTYILPVSNGSVSKEVNRKTSKKVSKKAPRESYWQGLNWAWSSSSAAQDCVFCQRYARSKMWTYFEQSTRD